MQLSVRCYVIFAKNKPNGLGKNLRRGRAKRKREKRNKARQNIAKGYEKSEEVIKNPQFIDNNQKRGQEQRRKQK